MDPMRLVNLTGLMERSLGNPGVVIALIDGPVAHQREEFTTSRIQGTFGVGGSGCATLDSAACRHGTFIAGMLVARRSSLATAICPGCTLLVRPIFNEFAAGRERMPKTTSFELASAIVECVERGAHVINLSVSIVQPSGAGELALEAALEKALRNNVIVVAAAGNQSSVGSTALTRHPWVIPVIACDQEARPMPFANLGHSIGKRGLSAPGAGVVSIDCGGMRALEGSSVAAPFVTGTIALLWSLFPRASAMQVKAAVAGDATTNRGSIVPPALNGELAFRALAQTMARRSAA